jgi:hypothetical protein
VNKETLNIFVEVGKSFAEIKDKVSLVKPYFELHFSSPGRAMTLQEFEEALGFKPELLFKSKENLYGISVIFSIDAEVTRGIIAHEFAELIAREKDIGDHEIIDDITVQRGFGRELLLALENILPGRVERTFIDTDDLRRRVNMLREKNIKPL